MAALSIERYIDARSIISAKFRALIIFGSLVLIWTLGLLLPYPFIFYTYLEVRSHTINSTNSTNFTTITLFSCQSYLTEKELLVHEIILYIIAFIIPYSIILLFSLKLLKFLRHWLKRREKLICANVTRKRTRGVKLVLCIVVSFLICYTPFWTFKFYTRFIVDEKVRRQPLLQRVLFYLHLLVVLLNYFTGIFSPLFFIILTDRFCSLISKHRQKQSRLLTTRSTAFIFNERKKSNEINLVSPITEVNRLLQINNDQSKNNHQISVIVQNKEFC